MPFKHLRILMILIYYIIRLEVETSDPSSIKSIIQNLKILKIINI